MREKHLMHRLVLLALLLYALGTYTQERGELRRQQAVTRELENRKQLLLAERQELEGRAAACEDDTLLLQLAWERLRMLPPGDRVFCFTTEAEPDA